MEQVYGWEEKPHPLTDGLYILPTPRARAFSWDMKRGRPLWRTLERVTRATGGAVDR